MINATPFIKTYRYLPHFEKLSYSFHFPYVNSCSTGKVLRYTYPMQFVPFFYNIPYFYLDGE